MSSVKKNIVANFLGNTWGSVMNVIIVPVYIYFIGIEQYGLLGIFTIFQSVVGLLDMGLTPTLNREMARSAALPDERQNMNDLLFSMERIVLVISLITAAGLVASSGLIAHHWVNLEKLDVNTVVIAFILMGINFGIQFSFGIYQGGFMGLQKQVALNTIFFCATTLKPILAILALHFISHSILSLLAVQIAVNIAQLICLRYYLWKFMPTSPEKPVFNRKVLRKSGRFAAGIFTISILTIFLTQIDKIILSNSLKLTQYGYYALATAVAGTLAMLLYAITGAVFPKMTEYVSSGRQEELKTVFHKSSQLVSVTLMPVALGIFIFADDLLAAWTRNPEIVANTGPVLKYLVLGTAINSLMTIPYQYSLSVGWLRFGINISVVAIIVFVPAILFAAYNYGITGCAKVWLILNIAYFIFAMLYLFSRHLTSERWKWYFTDIGRPLLVCVLTAAPFFFIREFIALKNIYYLLLFTACTGLSLLTTLFWGCPALQQDIQKILSGRLFRFLKKPS